MEEPITDPGAPERALDNDYPRNVRGNAGFAETLLQHDEIEAAEQGASHSGDEVEDPGSIGNQNRGDDDDRNSHDDLGVPVLGSASAFPEQGDEPSHRNHARAFMQELDQGDQMQRMAEDSPIWDNDLAIANSSDEDATSSMGMPRGSTKGGDE
jgi:hypothetical protein